MVSGKPPFLCKTEKNPSGAKMADERGDNVGTSTPPSSRLLAQCRRFKSPREQAPPPAFSSPTANPDRMGLGVWDEPNGGTGRKHVQCTCGMAVGKMGTATQTQAMAVAPQQSHRAHSHIFETHFRRLQGSRLCERKDQCHTEIPYHAHSLIHLFGDQPQGTTSLPWLELWPTGGLPHHPGGRLCTCANK